MRIRRPAPASHSPRGAGAENSSDGSMSPSGSAELRTASSPQQGLENVHFSDGNLSMIYSESKFRASVNWLDRLRTAKGFPVDHNIGVEEALSSRTCSSEETQCCRLDQDASACFKQEARSEVDPIRSFCNNTDNQQCGAPQTSSHRASISDMKNTKVPLRSFSRRNGTADIASLRSHTFGELSSLALRVQDVSHESSNTALDASCCQSLQELPSSSSIAAPNSMICENPSRTDKCSRNTVVQQTSCQDSRMETMICENLSRADKCSRDTVVQQTSCQDSRMETMICENLSRADKCSRDTVVQQTSCQDSQIETALSQLYYNVFAELFCMESCDANSLLQPDAKRRHRKQEKPKVCSTFADLDPQYADDPSPQLQTCEFDTYPTHALDVVNPTSQSEVDAVAKTDMPSSSPEVQGEEATLNQPKKAPTKVFMAESKRKTAVEAKGLPKSDLFIIDTSLPGWRTEKVIFRKGNGWRVRSKKAIFCAKGGTAGLIVNDETKLEVRPLSCGSKLDDNTLQKQLESDACIGKNHEADIDQTPSPNPELVDRHWNIAPHTHIRSSRKRRKSTLLAEETLNEISETICPNTESVKKDTGLEPDHPANQPKEGLVYSVYQVFMQAGKSGLTAREAVSRILEQGLPGLHEGGVVPRVEVLKIISNSPYFMPLEESKYILCSALVGDEDVKLQCKLDRQKVTQNAEPNVDRNTVDCSDNVKPARQHAVSQYWAACAAIRRARTGTTRRKPSSRSHFLNPVICETHEDIAYLANKKRLKYLKQDMSGLGNPCNRSDGKGWHCPLRAKVGYLLCDHHLDRLRTRVKHIKSKMLSVTKGTKEERKQILAGSWMVKNIVERTHAGRPSTCVDIQDSFPDSIAPESSVSNVS